MFPRGPAFNAKPAPMHTGDFDAAGFSTVELTSSGWALLQGGAGGSGQDTAAAKYAGPITSGGLSSPLVALVALGALLVYLDRRIAR